MPKKGTTKKGTTKKGTTKKGTTKKKEEPEISEYVFPSEEEVRRRFRQRRIILTIFIIATSFLCIVALVGAGLLSYAICLGIKGIASDEDCRLCIWCCTCGECCGDTDSLEEAFQKNISIIKWFLYYIKEQLQQLFF